MMVAVLVLVTIGFEQGSEAIEEHVKESGSEIQNELLQKMFKELTVLGFVAFCATMLLQSEILPLSHDRRGQSGRLGGATAGHHQLTRLHSKARDCSQHS